MTYALIIGIIGLPLVASLLVLALRRWQGPVVVGGQLLGTVAAMMALGRATASGMAWQLPLGIPGYPFQLLLTRQAVLIALTVALVGLLVSLFALGYMRGDPAQTRFWSTFGGFVVAMQLFVLAGDWILLLVGWELMSLASFLLIGFYNQREEAVLASRRAFMTTRVGDIGLYLAALLLIATSKSSFLPATMNVTSGQVALLAGLGLLVAGAVKAAQFPFDGWLRDAMAGPTPVSALLHSATMVAAGFLLLLKTQPLLTPRLTLLVAVVGGITGIVAGVIAYAQSDLKRLLAASTSSQLGFMLLALGAGSPAAALLFFIAQAFMKSGLFMVAGAFQRAAGSTDFSKLGGLGKAHRLIYTGFIIAGLGLAAIPPLAGFWSKDAVVAATFTSGNSALLVPLVLVGALMTGAYMARAIWLLGAGQEKGKRIDGLSAMAIGLFGTLTVVIGFGLIITAFESFTGAQLPRSIYALPFGLSASVIGLVYGFWQAARHPHAVGRFSVVAAEGFYASQSFDVAVAAMVRWGSAAVTLMDSTIYAGTSVVARAAVAAAAYTENTLEAFFQHRLDEIATYAALSGDRLRRWQSGLVHRELAASFYMAAGLVLMSGIIIMLKELL